MIDSLPLRILVVDDDQDTADSLATILRMAGHGVSTARSGCAALEAFEADEPDVMLLDLAMPGMDGFEVARQVRTRGCGPRIFLIAVSGFGRDEDRRQSAEAGIDIHLIKPACPEVLLDLLAQYSLTRGGDASTPAEPEKSHQTNDPVLPSPKGAWSRP